MTIKDPEKRRETQRKYYQDNREKRREYDRKYQREYREENREKIKEYRRQRYQENREQQKENRKYLRFQALDVYDWKCQFQAQTITIEGKKHHFKSCDQSWQDITVPKILQWHHKNGGGRKESTGALYRRIRDIGYQDDIELLCPNHHKLADIRDGTDRGLYVVKGDNV